MTAPNIVNLTSVYGRTSMLAPTTVAASVVSNELNSNSVIKVNSTVISNIHANNSANVTVDIFRSGVPYKIVSGVSIPVGTTFIAIGKDFPIYLEEGDSIRATASANSSLTAICSYEVIS